MNKDDIDSCGWHSPMRLFGHKKSYPALQKKWMDGI